MNVNMNNELVKFLQDELKYWQSLAYQERQKAKEWKDKADKLEKRVEELEAYIGVHKQM